VPAFDISTLTHAVELEPGSVGRVDFNVQSQITKTVFARADLEPDPANTAAIGSWLSVDGGKHERRFEATAAEKYTVLVAAPADASPGSYLFRLRTLATSEPASEYQVLSEPVEVTIKPLVPAFDITTVPQAVEIEPGGVGNVGFTVQSQITKPLVARAELEADETNTVAIAPWLAIDGGTEERRFEAAATEKYTTIVSVPADAKPGKYAFSLRIVTTSANASAVPHQSEPVALTVTARQRNWWRIAAIALAGVDALLLVAAIVLLAQRLMPVAARLLEQSTALGLAL
jgi:hypothetical protein